MSPAAGRGWLDLIGDLEVVAPLDLIDVVVIWAGGMDRLAAQAVAAVAEADGDVPVVVVSGDRLPVWAGAGCLTIIVDPVGIAGAPMVEPAVRTGGAVLVVTGDTVLGAAADDADVPRQAVPEQPSFASLTGLLLALLELDRDLVDATAWGPPDQWTGPGGKAEAVVDLMDATRQPAIIYGTDGVGVAAAGLLAHLITTSGAGTCLGASVDAARRHAVGWFPEPAVVPLAILRQASVQAEMTEAVLRSLPTPATTVTVDGPSAVHDLVRLTTFVDAVGLELPITPDTTLPG